MHVTLFALLVCSVLLIALHAPYAALTLGVVVILATVVTRVSWAVLQSFEPVKVTDRPWD
jgi:hypothetical protein